MSNLHDLTANDYFDGDDFTNLQERQLDTDPTDIEGGIGTDSSEALLTTERTFTMFIYRQMQNK